jgi:hypothetical protein
MDVGTRSPHMWGLDVGIYRENPVETSLLNLSDTLRGCLKSYKLGKTLSMS